MFFPLLTILTIFSSLEGKPVIVRNISDCSITEDGILHYQGKHSYTKFEHECLPWTNFQMIYSEMINEANFFHDASIQDAENYCRNPNMNINGPWCFVQDDDAIGMEGCDVCQSLAVRPTLRPNIGRSDDVTAAAVNSNFFQNARDEFLRFAAYIRQKFMQLFNRIKEKVEHFSTKIRERFNFGT